LLTVTIAFERFGGEFVDIVDFADRHDPKGPQVGTDNQRLRVMIADDANSFAAAQFWKIGFEFGPEIIIFDVVDRAGKIA
jgi:hypothetical protein